MKFSSLALVATLAFAKDDKNDSPKKGSIKVSANGKGCSKDSVSGYLGQDLSYFTLQFDSLSSSNSKGGKDDKNDCTIDVTLKAEKNWQFSINRIAYKGYGSLEKDGEAYLSTDLTYAGQTTSAYETLKGQLSENFRAVDYFGKKIWSDCNDSTSLSIDTYLTLGGKGKDKTGYVNVDSEYYYIQWRKCN